MHDRPHLPLPGRMVRSVVVTLATGELLILILHRPDDVKRSESEGGDLFWPASLAFTKQVDQAALTHVALHP